MVLDSSDLQHRRTSASTISSKRAIRSNGNGNSNSNSRRRTTTNRSRRKRNADPNRAALAATVLFACVVIPIVWIIHRFILGRGTDADGSNEQQQHDNDNGNNNKNHFLTNWKPKQHRRINGNNNGAPIILSSSVGPEAEERAAKREARYQSLYQPKFDSSTLGYDIYNCPPDGPPPNYPYSWKTTQLLTQWESNDVTTLSPQVRQVHHSLCIFDYTNTTQYSTAVTYRNAEQPFVIRNDPKVVSVSHRWEDDVEYLHRIFGDTTEFRTERSPTPQFMWYRLRGNTNNNKGPRGYTKPENDEMKMTFGEYLEHALLKDGEALGEEELIHKANGMRDRRLGLDGGGSLLLAANKKKKKKKKKEEEDTDDDPLSTEDTTTTTTTKHHDNPQQQQHNNQQRHNKHATTNEDEEDTEEQKDTKYYYFRLNADTRTAKSNPTSPSKFIYDELPFFDPQKNDAASEFYIVDPTQERGINCRFGMRGVTAVNHFDMSRNMIAVLGGERRYVISHPNQCERMALYPKGHPSVRHSSMDWDNPAEWTGTEFEEAMSTEVVLHAGDVLYLPTNWFHYIVNLSLNYQCNARSGTTHETAKFIDKCGFDMK